MSAGRDDENKPTIAAIRRAIDSGNWVLAEELLHATDPPPMPEHHERELGPCVEEWTRHG